MNYSELVTEIQSYTENAFATADINTFIRQAEQRIYNSVQLPALRKTVTLTTTPNNSSLAIPSDWLATFSMAVVDPVTNNQEFLLNKDVNFIREAYPSATATGKPQYYAIQDSSNFILGPTPNLAYSIQLAYFDYPESIVTAGTTWLGNNFDSVLLYGSLLEAYTYMKGESDVMNVYKQQYDMAMQLLKQLGDGKNRRDSYRSGQIRYPVQ